jgi:hypothetical protein
VNPSKVEQILANQTALARKVYDATPFEQPATAAVIGTEMKRLHGTVPPRNVIEGCLGKLVGANLVRQTDKTHYIRVPVRELVQLPDEEPAPSLAEEPAPSLAEVVQEAESHLTSVDRLGMISTSLRSAMGVVAEMRMNLQHALDRLQEIEDAMTHQADQIDATGVQVDDELKQAGEAAEQLATLKKIFNTIK